MTTPLLTTRLFEDTTDRRAVVPDVMTERGTARAITILVAIMAAAGAVGWAITDVAPPGDGAPPPFVFPATLGAVGVAVFAAVRPRRSRVLAPLYAVLQGVVLGSVSHRYEGVSEGVVAQAIAATAATLAAVTVLYRGGAFRVTGRFRARVLGAGGGLLLFWLVTGVVRSLGIQPAFLDTPGIAILVSLLSVGVAAFFLVLDFEVIATGVRERAPRDLEWHAALGVVLTLVWIYLELLALLGDSED